MEWSYANGFNRQKQVHFVDGSLKQPTIDIPTYDRWIRCDTRVFSWIMNSIAKEIASNIIYLNLAEAMWKDLKERFIHGNDPRIYQLRKTISSLTQGNMRVSIYYAQLKGLWDELDHYRSIPSLLVWNFKTLAIIQSRRSVLQFLMGLDDKFTAG